VEVRAHAAVVVDEVGRPVGVGGEQLVELGEALGGGVGVAFSLPAGGDALEAGDVEADAGVLHGEDAGEEAALELVERDRPRSRSGGGEGAQQRDEAVGGGGGGGEAGERGMTWP
jgi:hypothetical protein